MAKTRTIVRTCEIDGCERLGNAGWGWCWTHYSRWRTNGDPNRLGPRGERGTIIADPIERFWAKVEKVPDGCWYWKGSRRTRGGYGSLALGGRTWVAHRLSYTWLVGDIPEGLVLDHLCREPSCVNPAHLEPVTLAENSARAAKYRRTPDQKCARSHAMADDNLVIRKDGTRYCRECFNNSQRGRRAKYRAERSILNALAALPLAYESDLPAVNDLIAAVNRWMDARYVDSEW